MTSSWEVADRYLTDLAEVDPEAAAVVGRPADLELPDISPEGLAARHQVDVTALASIGSPSDPLGIALKERLRAQTALYNYGFTTTLLAPLATPIHQLRQVFDDLPRESEQDWHRVAEHLSAVATGYRDYTATLMQSRARGQRISRRQALIVADQCAGWIDPAGTDFYRRLVTDYQGSPALSAQLRSGAEQASAAADVFVDFLRQDLAPTVQAKDAVGPEMYQVTSRAFLGAEVDLRELYEYGWSELARLTSAATTLGRQLTGHQNLAAARSALDERPGSCVTPGPELVSWLQNRMNRVTAALSGTHFDIPANTLPVEAKMVTAGSGVMYYSAPDPGGTRPGRVWWSVPPGTTSVPTWREVSTVHHEGLPGHHLQFAVTQGIAELHPWQRYLCHIHGYAEGWAHYSEQLAVDLGLLEDDAEQLGVYGAQLWRAARIVIDLGLHLGYPIPPGTGLTSETSWTPEVAVQFLHHVAGVDLATAGYEVDRYLGWPGQALAFKVGAKLWTQARSEQQQLLGNAFNQKEFHMTALRLGPMGLDPLRSALSSTAGSTSTSTVTSPPVAGDPR